MTFEILQKRKKIVTWISYFFIFIPVYFALSVAAFETIFSVKTGLFFEGGILWGVYGNLFWGTLFFILVSLYFRIQERKIENPGNIEKFDMVKPFKKAFVFLVVCYILISALSILRVSLNNDQLTDVEVGGTITAPKD